MTQTPNGNERYYVRKPGHRKIRIRETFKDVEGRITPAFMKAYFEALEALDGKRAAPKTPREMTFYWLVDQYYRSSKFKNFDPLTQADKRSVLNRYCETAGELPYASCRKDDVEASQDKRRETPGAADKLVKYLRSLFSWAIDKKLATFNPAVGIAKINETEGWHTWTPAEVDIYRSHHKIGSKARLALELMLNVGARISDASRIGRQHERNGWLVFVAWKNVTESLERQSSVRSHANLPRRWLRHLPATQSISSTILADRSLSTVSATKCETGATPRASINARRTACERRLRLSLLRAA